MFDLTNLLLTPAANSYTAACVFGGTPTGAGSLNTGSWIQINLLVVILSFSVSALVYTFSNFFPTSMRTKMQGAAKYEAFQGIVSIAIIIVLIAFSSITCQAGEALTASSAPVIHTTYQNPMQFAEAYIGNLMFTRGLSLFSQIYSESVLLAVNANIASTIEEALEEFTVNQYLSISFSPGLVGTLFGFSGALGATFEPMIVVCFGVLFMIYLLLPMIEALALTVIVPIALIMRSIPFAGPKLRESSDTFLALAIGFYFILPLALLMNSYIISWIYAPCTASSTLCNPYNQYTAPYQLAQVSTNQLFNTPPQTLTSGSSPLSGIKIPASFFSTSVANEGGILGGLKAVLEITFNLPSIMVEYSLKTAEYVFEGVVLIGLDLAITLAFAQGLTKGLNSVGKMVGVGPFWSG